MAGGTDGGGPVMERERGQERETGVPHGRIYGEVSPQLCANFPRGRLRQKARGSRRCFLVAIETC